MLLEYISTACDMTVYWFVCNRLVLCLSFASCLVSSTRVWCTVFCDDALSRFHIDNVVEEEDELVESARADEARFRAFRCFFVIEAFSAQQKVKRVSRCRLDSSPQTATCAVSFFARCFFAQGSSHDKLTRCTVWHTRVSY